MFKEGLEQKGKPPSPTKSKAEQPEDLQDYAEGRWSDSFSELLTDFAFWGKRFTLNSREVDNFHLRMLFARTWKVPFGQDRRL